MVGNDGEHEDAMNANKTQDGGPAFPQPVAVLVSAECFHAAGIAGMTLRDWFAGMALIGSMASDRLDYEFADAMVKARKP